MVNRVEPTPTGARVHADDGRTFDGRIAVIATGAAFGLLKRSGILSTPARIWLAARAYFEDLQTDVAHSSRCGSTARHAGLRLGLPGKSVGGEHRRRILAASTLGTASAAFEHFIQGTAVRQLLAGAHQAGPLKGYPIRIDFLKRQPMRNARCSSAKRRTGQPADRRRN